MTDADAWPLHDVAPCARYGQHLATQRHPLIECPTYGTERTPGLDHEREDRMTDHDHDTPPATPLPATPSLPLGLTEYRFTVGVQYGRTVHPHLPHAVSDGWVAVYAASRDEARALATAVLGNEWAFDYEVTDQSPEEWVRHHPLGPIHFICSMRTIDPDSLGMAQHLGHDLSRWEA